MGVAPRGPAYEEKVWRSTLGLWEGFEESS